MSNTKHQAPTLRRGGGGPFAMTKEKPQNTMKTISRLMGYIARSKGLFFATMIIVLINTVILLYCNVLVKDVITSLGELDENFHFIKNPNSDKFIFNIVLLKRILGGITMYIDKLGNHWYKGNLHTHTFGDFASSDVAKEFVKESLHVESACRRCKWYKLCRGGCKRCREPFVNGRPGLNRFCEAYKGFFKYAYPKMEQMARALSK